MRVHVLVRVKEPDLGNRDIEDPEPAEDPLVLRAKPDLAGHPLRERQGPDLAEIICQQVLVKRFRVDVVAQYPDPDEHHISLLEGGKVVRKLRVVRVLLPPVAHLLREFFCIADCCQGSGAAGHVLSGVCGALLKGLWLKCITY